MSDPVASKSMFLCKYMSTHPDTLVAYVKHFGNVPGNVKSAEMKSIDSKGMNLAYSLKGGGAGSVHVRFDPPLSGYEDVRPRLHAMDVAAKEALGMLQSPKITSFRLPHAPIYFPLIYVGLAYCIFTPPLGTSLPFIPTHVSDLAFAPARALFRAIHFQPSTTTIAIAAVIHALESLYTWYLCRRYVQGLSVKAMYIFSTFIFGFPIWVDLKSRITTMRIESVMKSE